MRRNILPAISNLKQVDRRITRTRRMLHAALVELILEKGFNSLTVNEIVKRADISRSTFYLHYQTKEELLLDSVDQVINDLAEQVAELPIKGYEKTGVNDVASAIKTPLEIVFEEAAKSARLYQVVLRSEWISTNKLRDMIAEVVKVFLSKRIGARDIKTVVPIDAFGQYFAGALLGILTWWLDNDMPYPPEEMAKKFQKLFLNGSSELIVDQEL